MCIPRCQVKTIAPSSGQILAEAETSFGGSDEERCYQSQWRKKMTKTDGEVHETIRDEKKWSRRREIIDSHCMTKNLHPQMHVAFGPRGEKSVLLIIEFSLRRDPSWISLASEIL